MKIIPRETEMKGVPPPLGRCLYGVFIKGKSSFLQGCPRPVVVEVQVS